MDLRGSIVRAWDIARRVRRHPGAAEVAQVVAGHAGSWPYSASEQQRLGRATTYYRMYAHGKNNGLWGACTHMVYLEDRIRGLETQVAKLDAAMRQSVIDKSKPVHPWDARVTGGTRGAR